MGAEKLRWDFRNLEIWKRARELQPSLFELLDHLIVARDNLYIQDEQYYSIENSIEDEIKLINGYIRHLRKKKAEERPHD